jgi:hypothetical protein
MVCYDYELISETALCCGRYAPRTEDDWCRHVALLADGAAPQTPPRLTRALNNRTRPYEQPVTYLPTRRWRATFGTLNFDR